jgi:hypothetical protein
MMGADEVTNSPQAYVDSGSLQRLAVMLRHPSSMAHGTLAKKISREEEDRGHRQARVRLSKATWANIIATRYKVTADS